jgi:hypothetical protein
MLKGEICIVIYLIIVRITLFVAYMHGRCNACFLVYGNVIVGECDEHAQRPPANVNDGEADQIGKRIKNSTSY